MMHESLLPLELKHFFRNRSYVGLLAVLILLMTLAAWKSHIYTAAKAEQTEVQLQKVKDNDANLIAQIDSLNQGLATYEDSYTLPTSGVRLTYNNHRITWLPFQPFSLIAIGQGDIYSNYKKIVLYFNDSYEMRSEELVSPLEQLFGQLDLTFVWVYLLPLIILLTSFNVLSIERESGRLSLIASQPIKLSYWVLRKIIFQFFIIFTILLVSTVALLLIFNVDLANNLSTLGLLILTLFLYSAFWFLLSFLVNLAGYNSGRSLIILTSIWVFFVFLIPSAVNLLAKETNPIPSRLEIVNHHLATYNEMEANLDVELEQLYQRHPDWYSEKPVTKDMSNSTGWNINYLAKQYIAQLKHRSVADNYELQVDKRNQWVENFKILSPSMIVQSALTDLAGTSSGFYRSYLRQAQQYAQAYRQYVFKRVFTNHFFTSDEIRALPVFQFDTKKVPRNLGMDLAMLFAYLVALGLFCTYLAKRELVK